MHAFSCDTAGTIEELYESRNHMTEATQTGSYGNTRTGIASLIISKEKLSFTNKHGGCHLADITHTSDFSALKEAVGSCLHTKLHVTSQKIQVSWDVTPQTLVNSTSLLTDHSAE
jgi:hypothetical protein